jgi:hypothetical protein
VSLFPVSSRYSDLQLLHINLNGGMNRSAAAADGSGARSNQNVETLKRGIDVH